MYTCDKMFGRRRQGFALLVTIVLVAFLVLLLVGLATFTKVETQVSSNAQQLAQARQNALYALNIAVGEIQEHAGPDARVTARADVLETNNASYALNPYYVGVWDTSNTNATPRTWLISGNEVSALNNPTQTPLTDRTRNTFQNSNTLVSVVGAKTAGATGGVVVPKVDISSSSVPGIPGSITVGRYAWWAGDESVKARVNLPENSGALSVYESRADVRAVARQESPRQTPVANVLAGVSNLDANLGRVVLDEQLALLTGADLTNVRDRYHDVSVSSAGVIANTEDSPNRGLKRDLTQDPSLISAQFQRIADFAAYMQAPTAADYTRKYTMRAASSTSSGAIIDSVSPALTEFILNFYITGTVGSNQLRLRAQGLFELFNPYTSELAREPLQLIVEGLPTVTVTSSTGGGGGSTTINLDTVLKAGQPQVVIHLPDGSGLGDPNLFRFLPGRILNWAGVSAPGVTTGTPSPTLLSIPNSRNSPDGQRDFLNVATLPAPLVAGDTLSLTGPSVTLVVSLVKASDGTVLAKYTSPNFDALVKGSYNSTTLNNPFVYRFRMRDRNNYINPGDWLEEVEPRHPAPPASYFFTSTSQPGNAPALATTSTVDTTQLFNRAASTTATALSISQVQDLPLFELPRAPYLNLAGLQNLGVIGERPYFIGNSWADARNDYFDRYFFSGTTSSNPVLGMNPQPFRNQRHKFYMPSPMTPPSLADFNGAANSRSSAFLLAEGQFNINSTSEKAWAAMLASITVPSWDFVNYGQYGAQNTGAATISGSLDGVFLRFPQSAQEAFDNYRNNGSVLTPPNPLAPAQRLQYRRGVIRISSADRIALSQRIVRNIKQVAAANGPMRTMRQFLGPQSALSGESILDEAISNVAGTSGTWIRNERAFTELSTMGLSGDIDANAPSYLLQSDILTAIAAAVAPRGDTFTIRTYGEVVNPATNEREASAWLEATVQRIPDFVDSSDPATDNFSDLNAVNQSFGRAFKVVQFQWLEKENL